MIRLKSFACLAVLTVTPPSLADVLPLGSGTARCDPADRDISQCTIRWDLSATPRASYSVQWLNPATGAWEPLFKHRFDSPHQHGGHVDVGKLYRVLGCSDGAMRKNCVSTTAHWASVVLPVDKIPDSVRIGDSGDDVQVAAVSKDAEAYTQVMQLNVYLLADVLKRASEASLPPMIPPAEPGTPGDMAHDVHHNVHVMYEATRRDRMLRLAEQSATPD